MKRSPRIGVVVSEDIYKAIENLAREQRRTMSSMTALICEDYLREHGLLPKE